MAKNSPSAISRSTTSTARTLPNSGDGAAPHPPAGTFSPYSDGEGANRNARDPPLPVLHGERVRVRAGLRSQNERDELTARR
ncbi:MAG: hypothetical protein E5X07_20620 [Mesorhizobium sp.]|nr:MAG: hypothetical protein E5X07_20620 [Mesorhizobium sp.]